MRAEAKAQTSQHADLSLVQINKNFGCKIVNILGAKKSRLIESVLFSKHSILASLFMVDSSYCLWKLLEKKTITYNNCDLFNDLKCNKANSTNLYPPTKGY